MHAAPAVHGDDLAGDVGRILDQEAYRTCDVLWVAFSLLVFDLDHFKSVNDRFGHLAGDALLRQLGSILLGRLRVNDVLARIGGEEFGLITPEVGLDGARELAGKINRLIGDTRFEFEGSAVKITASIGVAEWQADYEDAWDLFKAADDKMYEAKRAGRNQVCF